MAPNRCFGSSIAIFYRLTSANATASLRGRAEAALDGRSFRSILWQSNEGRSRYPMSESYFQGKTAVVTGAGGTLCAAVAKELARLGARVALLGRTVEKLETVAADIRAAGGMALPIATDVIDAEAVEAARQAIEAEFGACELLINGAGGSQVSGQPLGKIDHARLRHAVRGYPRQRTIAIHRSKIENPAAASPSHLSAEDLARDDGSQRVNAKHIRKTFQAEVEKAAHVVRFGRVNFFRHELGHRGHRLELVSAGAVDQQFARPELGFDRLACSLHGLRVNAVAPGFFLNDRSRKILLDEAGAPSRRGRNVIAHTALRRFGEAEELLGCVCWLLDDTRAGFVTGITVPVDGGFLASSGV
jgi:hypothetical protein